MLWCVVAVCLWSVGVARGAHVDSPLLLTPLIQRGDVHSAQRHAAVDLLGVPSYSGFLTVNEHCDNHLFFWFVPARNNWKNAPVVLWLNGGKGLSAISGVFEDIGPWKVERGELKKRDYPWTEHFNVVFIDEQPNTGFSFSEKRCSVESTGDLVKDVYSGLMQFFTMFHEIAGNQFFIAGSYFVSHYGTALAVEIKDRNKKEPEVKIQMSGVLVVNPRTSVSCHDFSEQIFQLGIVDPEGKEVFRDLHTDLVRKVRQMNFQRAAEIEREMLTKLSKDTELPTYYNFVADSEPDREYLQYVVTKKVRRIIHVGDVAFNNDNVFDALLEDYFSSPKPYVENLLRDGEVVVGFYNTQLDIVSSYSSTLCFLDELQWQGSQGFREAHRAAWHLEGELVGWVKAADSLVEILVRKSGEHPSVRQGRLGLHLVKELLESRPPDLLQAISPDPET